MKEEKTKKKHPKKNVVPFNKQKKSYNPASQLPKSIREADQNQQSEVENQMSPEEYEAFLKEFEAFKRYADERMKAYENY